MIAIVIGWHRLPAVPGHDIPRPNPWAALLVTVGVAALTLGIVKGNDWGWASPAVLASFAAALLSLGLFVRHCLVSANPFVDPSLFRMRQYTGATLVMALLLDGFRRDAAFDRSVGGAGLGLVGDAHGPRHRAPARCWCRSPRSCSSGR